MFLIKTSCEIFFTIAGFCYQNFSGLRETDQISCIVDIVVPNSFGSHQTKFRSLLKGQSQPPDFHQYQLLQFCLKGHEMHRDNVGSISRTECTGKLPIPSATSQNNDSLIRIDQ